MRYLTFYDGLFRWLGPYDTRMLPKDAGFYWNTAQRQWQTPSHEKALRLKDYCDPAAADELNRWKRSQQQQLESSRATTADIEIPAPPGLSYLDYQKAGVAYAMRRDGTLIADEMGLGKTIQAIGVVNAMGREVKRVLVICPATLKINWQRELDKWLVRDLSIGVVNTKSGWPGTDVVIINYDIVHKFSRELRSVIWDVVICDEAHYIKNPKAQRTIHVVGDKQWDSARKAWTVKVQPIQARKRLLLTGTPIYNKPQDLWTIVDYCLLTTPVEQRYKWFRFKTQFLQRYAGYQQTRYGWEFTGAQNLEELHENLRLHLMIRRLKSQVLTELPPKIRQVVEVDSTGFAEVIKAEYEHAKKKQEALLEAQAEMEIAKASGDEDAYREAVKRLRAAHRVAFEEMAKVRHDVGLATAEASLGLLEDAVESSGKVVIFAHHRDVIEMIEQKLGEQYKVVKVVGGMSPEQKQASVDAFQNDPETRVFIGSITAAGVGITLTAASHVIFVELDWVPANIEQGEDRCHRIGQTDPVLVQHLVLEGSLTARIAQTIVEKQETNRKALDGKGMGGEDRPEFLDEPIVPAALAPTESAPSAASVVLTPRQRIEAEAQTISEAQRATIHATLRYIAGLCDKARNLDDVGFNKLDASIGHKLAQTPYESFTNRMAALAKVILRKYRRQIVGGLGERVYEDIYGPGSAHPDAGSRKRNPERVADELDELVRTRGL